MFQYKKSILFKKLDEEFNNIAKEVEKLEMPGGFFQFILYAISELFANIREHSRATKASMKIEIRNTHCLIEISDNGIGLRKSYLSKNIYPKDDSSAIEFALSGLSTKKPAERGFGLYTIRKFIEKLNGKMMIETGRALSIIERNKIQFKNFLKEKKGIKIYLETKIKDINFYKIVK